MFETIVSHVPEPKADVDGEFKMLVTLLDRDNFLGRILTGLVLSGTVKVNQQIHALIARWQDRRNRPRVEDHVVPRS